MTNIVKFPKIEKQRKLLPRQRVFYIGFRYVGPFLCQDVQNIYLKRNGLKEGLRTWSLITYGKYDENDYKEYSIELESCEENDLPDLLNEFDVGNQINFDELRKMGWNGQVDYTAKIIKLFKKNIPTSSMASISILSEEE